MSREAAPYECPRNARSFLSPNCQGRRTKFLEKQGLTVIRFENQELNENLDRGCWREKRSALREGIIRSRYAGHFFY
jgi:hypothetical protein